MAKAQLILVVVDPTATEQPAVARGIDMARRLGMRLELLACVHEGRPVSMPRGIEPLSARRAALCGQLEKLRGLAADCSDIEVVTRAIWDRPLYEGIIREILRSEPRLVMKDSHYHSAISRALVTNTDWHLIRHCPVPLWLVRGGSWPSAPRIAAFVDPSHEMDKPADLDHRILDEAVTLARELGGRMHAIHCHDSDALPAGFCAPCAGVEAAVLNAESQAEHAQWLQELLDEHDIPADQMHLHRGQAAEMIPVLARDMELELAIMGAITRSRLQHAFIGSTTEQVLDKLSCDVLVVKPKRFESAVTYRPQASDFMEMDKPPGF